MKKRTAKRALKWIGITIGVLLIIIAAGAAVMFGPFVKAANSIEKLEDGLYAMEFAGDYGFDDFLANGGAASNGEVAEYLVSFLSHGFYKADGNVTTGSSTAPRYIRRMKTALTSLDATMTGQNVKP